MKKHPSYLGGHSQSGSSVGFVGWGRQSKNKRLGGPGLAGMSPEVDEATKFTLVKSSEIRPGMMGKHKKKKIVDRT